MGVLILSLAVYLFSSFKATANENLKRMEQEELAQFNSFYLSYEGRTDLTYYDVWNVVKKAEENNNSYGLDKYENNNFGINVYLESTPLLTSSFGIDSISDFDQTNGKVIKDDGTATKYKCTSVKINSVTVRVYKVKFNKNN